MKDEIKFEITRVDIVRRPRRINTEYTVDWQNPEFGISDEAVKKIKDYIDQYIIDEILKNDRTRD